MGNTKLTRIIGVIIAAWMMMNMMEMMMAFPERRPEIRHEIRPDHARDTEAADASFLWRYGGPYGVYCGIYHSSYTFEEPINPVDRTCQLHDTCISAAGSYLSCICNEQLSRRISEVCPQNITARERGDGYYRDQIITAMSVATTLCDNICDLEHRYLVSAERGFNAIPFYGPIDEVMLTRAPRQKKVMKMMITTTDQKEAASSPSLLIGIIPKAALSTFGDLNLIGKPPLSDFRQWMDGTYHVPEDSVLFVFNPMNVTDTFYAYER